MSGIAYPRYRRFSNKPCDEQTMAELEAQSERLGLIVITDGRTFEYARPGQVPPGWRRFRLVDRNAARPLKPTEPR